MPDTRRRPVCWGWGVGDLGGSCPALLEGRCGGTTGRDTGVGHWDLRGRTGAEGEAAGSQAEGGLGGVVAAPVRFAFFSFSRLLCCCFCSPRPVVYDAASRDRSSSALRRCLPAGWEGRQVRVRIAPRRCRRPLAAAMQRPDNTERRKRPSTRTREGHVGQSRPSRAPGFR